ncbi:MAG: hypothetical protein WA733_10350 [Methylocystis sp.]
MPRLAKGPHLKLRKQAGAKPIYYIIDNDRRISTGCTAKQRAKADEILETHIGSRFIPKPGKDFYASQALDLYQRDIVPNHTVPENTVRYMERLREFFRGMACADIDPAATASYVRWRTCTGKASINEPPRARRPVKPATVRRELSVLQASFNHAWKCRKLKNQIPISLPPEGPPRERWLTTSEAARLLLGALGCILAPYTDIATGAERWAVWRREKAVVSRHLTRFVLIGLRTATRHDAITGLGWQPHAEGGYFDLENRVMFRAEPGAKQTKKRRTPAPIPDKLLRHLARWKRESDGIYVVATSDQKLQRVSGASAAPWLALGSVRK